MLVIVVILLLYASFDWSPMNGTIFPSWKVIPAFHTLSVLIRPTTIGLFVPSSSSTKFWSEWIAFCSVYPCDFVATFVPSARIVRPLRTVVSPLMAPFGS